MLLSHIYSNLMWFQTVCVTPTLYHGLESVSSELLCCMLPLHSSQAGWHPALLQWGTRLSFQSGDPADAIFHIVFLWEPPLLLLRFFSLSWSCYMPPLLPKYNALLPPMNSLTSTSWTRGSEIGRGFDQCNCWIRFPALEWCGVGREEASGEKLRLSGMLCTFDLLSESRIAEEGIRLMHDFGCNGGVRLWQGSNAGLTSSRSAVDVELSIME